MARTTVDLDREALAQAQRALGTRSLSATVNTALREVSRRSALADFDVTRDIDGSPDDVLSGRVPRGRTDEA